jgi:SAM-dependent methyltransferase
MFSFRKKYVILAGLIIITTGGIVAYKYFFKSWDVYFEKKMYQDPRPLIIKAVALLERESAGTKKVLDLGAGVGNDAAFVLKQGWDLWIVEAHKKAVELLLSRHDIAPYSDHLTAIGSRFEELDWSMFPPMDFIYSSYSLPFCQPDQFEHLWKNLVTTLKPGGIFAGHFFAPDHGGFNAYEKRTMTLLTREQVLELFKDFRIEHFEEFNETSKSGVGKEVFAHEFEVIAQKVG